MKLNLSVIAVCTAIFAAVYTIVIMAIYTWADPSYVEPITYVVVEYKDPPIKKVYIGTLEDCEIFISMYRNKSYIITPDFDTPKIVVTALE